MNSASRSLMWRVPRIGRLAPKSTDERVRGTAQQELKHQKAVSLILRGMKWAYERGRTGLPGFESAVDLAGRYRASTTSKDEAIDKLVRGQVFRAGVAGAVTNIGGLITLPIAIPADLLSVLVIQLRMVAAIAYLRGYDPSDEEVQTFAYVCLAASSGAELLTQVGIKVGTSLSQRVAGASLASINRGVGLRLVTKAGISGFANISKLVPVLGAAAGGGLDAAMTGAIGAMAKRMFVDLDTTPVATLSPTAPVLSDADQSGGST